MSVTRLVLVSILSLAALPVVAQQPSRPIQDNSFLVEEAYNQEPGVVQHIQSFTRLWNSRTWAYTFTQEWPVPKHWRHQLSTRFPHSRPRKTAIPVSVICC